MTIETVIDMVIVTSVVTVTVASIATKMLILMAMIMCDDDNR